ncbi:MAG TPA: MBL fold metallo-hydrolase [Solirubrobacteraceae bacterium]
MPSDAVYQSSRGVSPATAAVTWLGHATALLELDGARLLTDPVIRDRIGPLIRVGPAIAKQTLGRVDMVLISHLHADHTDPRSLRDLGSAVPILAPAGARGWLRRHGLRAVREVEPGAKIRAGGLQIRSTPAVHDVRRRPLGPRAQPIGYVVEGSRSIYFAGDTDLFEGMTQMRGSIDAALLPVSGWGHRVGRGHLDPERAARAAAMIAPAVAIPIHWGTFALAAPARRPVDPERPAREFAALTARGSPGIDVRLLAPGEQTELR